MTGKHDDESAERTALRERIAKLCEKYGRESVFDNDRFKEFGFAALSRVKDDALPNANAELDRIESELRSTPTAKSAAPDWESVTLAAYRKWNHGWKRPEPGTDGGT